MDVPSRRESARRSRAYYPTFSALLLLSTILPTSAIAQNTNDVPSSTFQTITTSVSSLLPSPTSLSSGAPSATSTLSPSPNPTTPGSTATSTSTGGGGQFGPQEGFNYYFLIIAIAAVAFICFLLFMGRRTRRKILIQRANHQRALAEDIRGFRSPRYGRGWGWPTDGDRTTPPRGIGRRQRRQDIPEGLNERGEAPPPYVEGGKPPSLRSVSTNGTGPVERCETPRSVDRRASSEDVELGDMRRPGYDYPQRQPQGLGEPPAYDSSTTNTSNTGNPAGMTAITLPDPALTRP